MSETFLTRLSKIKTTWRLEKISIVSLTGGNGLVWRNASAGRFMGRISPNLSWSSVLYARAPKSFGANSDGKRLVPLGFSFLFFCYIALKFIYDLRLHEVVFGLRIDRREGTAVMSLFYFSIGWKEFVFRPATDGISFWCFEQEFEISQLLPHENDIGCSV